MHEEGDSGRNDKRKKWQTGNARRKVKKERCKRQKGVIGKGKEEVMEGEV